MAIELAPRGGCAGSNPKRCHAQCTACARLPVGGAQIVPRYKRVGVDIACDDWVAHGGTVLPIPLADHPLPCRPLEDNCLHVVAPAPLRDEAGPAAVQLALDHIFQAMTR